jgi:enoyl-CoA hydratase/carnithine racemase
MLDVQVEGNVATLIIDRPQARNALNSTLVQRLATTLEELDSNPGICAVVLEGTPPGFCAGSDLKELGQMNVREMRIHEARTATVARSIALLDTPVVAAVEGFALGGGFALAISCDIVVSGSSARWHLPEVSIGWIPPWGLRALMARVGAVTARRLTWGIDSIDGAEAHHLGIVDYLTNDGEAASMALDLARKIAHMPTPAVTSTKRFFAQPVLNDGELLDAHANRMFGDDCLHEQAQETLASFRRKLSEMN